MNKNSILGVLVIGACVGILAACGGEDEDKQVQEYEPTREAPEQERTGEYGAPPPLDDQERQQPRSTAFDQGDQQQASGQADDQQMQGTGGQEIPPAPAVQFRD